MDDAEKTLLGSAFDILLAATGKAWLLMLDKLERRKKGLKVEDWSACQPDILQDSFLYRTKK